MAGQPPNPANTNLNSHPPPPPTSSHSNAPYTPRSTSITDDSDNEFEPTPTNSPGGPQYGDLPPSYDEAQHHAVHDARNGIAPIDPNEIEAHRLTLNEGPDEPEVWEYRVRGEQLDETNDREQAPDYANHANDKATSVPVQRVRSNESIPVGHMQSESASSTAAMLNRALMFTRHEPDADVQNAPRLTRVVAVPQEELLVRSSQSLRKETRVDGRERGSKDGQRPPGYSAASSEALHASSNSSDESVQILRAYAKALHAHSVQPAEFMDFLDGLNALIRATNSSAADLLHGSSTIVHDYISGANEAFFAPRGLRVSLQSLNALLEMLRIPTERGQRARAIASVLDKACPADRRAQALYPWVEALDTGMPSPSFQTLALHDMDTRLWGRAPSQSASGHSDSYPTEKTRAPSTEYEDPPHSVPEPAEDTNPNDGSWGRGRGGFGGSHWSPFGAPGNSPFRAPGNGPYGLLGNGLFGAPGNGPFGLPGQRPSGAHGRRSYGNRGGPGNSQQAGEWHGNEWEEIGKDLGKIGQNFGIRMGDWGLQLGKRANTWGVDVGKMASGSDRQNRNTAGPTNEHTPDDLPPSYKASSSQETGVLRGDTKVNPSISMPSTEKGKDKSKDMDHDDDDVSSISSDSSDDSDSDSDDEDYPDTEAMFLKRVRSINEHADASAKKGKKSAEEVAHERALEFEQAQTEKEAMDLKIGIQLSKRAIRKELRQRGRDLKRQYRQKKRELRATHDRKGKGKAKKGKEWKEAKKEYRKKKKELRKEKLAARKEWREASNDGGKLKKEGRSDEDGQDEVMGRMVWVVIENLAL
ncbi:hypothetical protein EJ02DRAFT_85529 [Clathrospora elynae]|uniref:Uncharacterized protein n=1 Tax=Clathrospora elynae TaxID=706981 RepID=A0A6A5SWR6_9PLEO|nr:hypothetical protein EJ02DRAFT_85529 [Clathrospora elynae]